MLGYFSGYHYSTREAPKISGRPAFLVVLAEE
jgi:hypothetical protein